jgi:hypothetical protein
MEDKSEASGQGRDGMLVKNTPRVPVIDFFYPEKSLMIGATARGLKFNVSSQTTLS